jgi:hypothetical protein
MAMKSIALIEHITVRSGFVCEQRVRINALVTEASIFPALKAGYICHCNWHDWPFRLFIGDVFIGAYYEPTT